MTLERSRGRATLPTAASGPMGEEEEGNSGRAKSAIEKTLPTMPAVRTKGTAETGHARLHVTVPRDTTPPLQRCSEMRPAQGSKVTKSCTEAIRAAAQQLNSSKKRQTHASQRDAVYKKGCYAEAALELKNWRPRLCSRTKGPPLPDPVNCTASVSEQRLPEHRPGGPLALNAGLCPAGQP